MNQTSLASLLLFACSAALLAQDPVNQAPRSTSVPPAAQPNPAELLSAALRFTQGLPSLAIKAKCKLLLPELPADLKQFANLELPTLHLDLMVAFPSRFVLRSDEKEIGDVVCDGSQMLRTAPQFQLHSLSAAPKSVLELLGNNQGVVIPAAGNLRALLAPAGGKDALLDAKTVELLGEGKVGGKDAWHLLVRDDKLACEVWVQKGTEPWVLRHKPKLGKLDVPSQQEAGEGGGDGGDSGVSLEPAFDLEVVAVSRDLPKDVFSLKPPTGSKQVDDLGAAVQERVMTLMAEKAGADAKGGHDKPHETVGKPSPDVELTLLDGNKQKLSDLKGRVVVLDFWATWCGPCVQGLPKVAEVTTKLAAEGVVFHACNIGESKEKIEKFLTKRNLSISVAMVDRELASKFGVGGIPHTVVIGTDGVIKKVHVGFLPGVEKQLEKDILEVLGKSATQENGSERKDPPKDGKAEDGKSGSGGK